MNFRFSGHESFICKQFWLKKGYDFLIHGNKFTEDDSVIKLGVGKNMVSSIRYWMRAFGLTNENDEIEEIAHFIFNDNNGCDKYLEDIATIWLLHYQLIKTNYASIYSIFFTEFIKNKYEFSKNHLNDFIKRKCDEINISFYNQNTINNDISVLLRNYLKPTRSEGKQEIEDALSGLLLDLNILKMMKTRDDNGLTEEHYLLNTHHKDIPYQIMLFSILDNPRFSKSISLKQLQTEINSPSIIYFLNNESLFRIIGQIVDKYKSIIYTQNSGINELQSKKDINKWDVLKDYYAK